MHANSSLSLRGCKLTRQRKCELTLVEACQLGDYIKVRKLVEQGVSPDSAGTFGWTALQEATSEGHAAVVCLLFSFDCELDFGAEWTLGTLKDILHCMSLRITTSLKIFEAAHLLLCYNADVRARDRWKQAPLHRAAASGCTNMVKLPLDNSSNERLQDDQGYTPLHLAAAWGCPMTAQVLLDAASDIYAKNSNNKTATDVSQSSAGLSLLHAVACQTPKLQYLFILVIRKHIYNDPMQNLIDFQ